MKKTYSRASKLIVILTATGLIGLGCAAEQDPEAGGDPGSREVTLEVLSNLPDEGGVRKLVSLGSDTALMDDLMMLERPFVIDGDETRDLTRVRTGSDIVVSLNTGESATLRRSGDRLELASFTGEDDGEGDMPRGAVEAVRMLDGGIELFLSGSEGSEADTIIRLSGIEDLDAERGALVTSLALDSILVSLEDTEQISPPVAIALIAAYMGQVWMTTCGSLTAFCDWKCWSYRSFDVGCAGLTVSADPFSITLGGGYSCTCI